MIFLERPDVVKVIVHVSMMAVDGISPQYAAWYWYEVDAQGPKTVRAQKRGFDRRREDHLRPAGPEPGATRPRRGRALASAAGVSGGISAGDADESQPVSSVVEYRLHADGTLQNDVHRYYRKDGSAKEQGLYWYFRYHEGGKQGKKLYVGKSDDPEGELERKRSDPKRRLCKDD
jgi:hypothetical protein